MKDEPPPPQLTLVTSSQGKELPSLCNRPAGAPVSSHRRGRGLGFSKMALAVQDEPSKSLITALSKMLVEARAGKMRGVALVAVYDDRHLCTRICGESTLGTLHLALSGLLRDIEEQSRVGYIVEQDEEG